MQSRIIAIPTAIAVPAVSASPANAHAEDVLNRFGGDEHGVLGAVTPGDSIGSVATVSDVGAAFGIVDTVGVGVNSNALTIATPGDGAAKLTFILDDAAARGFTVLKSVSG
jgi:hypothetical protein